MRIVKVLALVLFFLLSMMFFVQNTEMLSKPMALEFNVFVKTWRSIPLPFYLLLLFAFVVGAVVSILFFIMDRMQLTNQIKQYRYRLGSLQQEVNSLRNLPLEAKSFPQVEPKREEDDDSPSTS
jgi:lipopolysaccharide assembly protein A